MVPPARERTPVALTEIHVAGYRSVRDLRLTLGPVNVLVGANGCGKSNLFRALALLAAAARGELARTLAAEGGMPSALWAGPRGQGPVRLTLSATFDQLGYEIACGLVPPVPSAGRKTTAFVLDPQVKEERIWFREKKKTVTLLERNHTHVQARDEEGKRVSLPDAVGEGESVLAELREPHRFPGLTAVRQELLSWRLYHRFRTDPASPLRQPQVGVRTTALGHDGQDLAAALQTIVEIGNAYGLNTALQQAFPGASLHTDHPVPGVFAVALTLPGFQRRFSAAELSDGTLHYLCLLAALLSPRPPALLALNEPEASLHPDLLEPLAHLIAAAARHSQVWVATHSEPLAGHLARLTGAAPLRLAKVGGETRLAAG
jgi:predicted ATPase